MSGAAVTASAPFPDVASTTHAPTVPTFTSRSPAAYAASAIIAARLSPTFSNSTDPPPFTPAPRISTN